MDVSSRITRLASVDYPAIRLPQLLGWGRRKEWDGIPARHLASNRVEVDAVIGSLEELATDLSTFCAANGGNNKYHCNVVLPKPTLHYIAI